MPYCWLAKRAIVNSQRISRRVIWIYIPVPIPSRQLTNQNPVRKKRHPLHRNRKQRVRRNQNYQKYYSERDMPRLRYNLDQIFNTGTGIVFMLQFQYCPFQVIRTGFAILRDVHVCTPCAFILNFDFIYNNIINLSFSTGTVYLSDHTESIILD